jgi:hypothetical protein
LDGQTILHDVTIVHATAPSYPASATFRSLARKRIKAKRRLYCEDRALCAREHFVVLPVSAHGELGSACRDLIQMIADLRAVPVHELRCDLGATLQELLGRGAAAAAAVGTRMHRRRA